MKKLISVLLCFMILVSSFMPLGIFADTEVTEGVCGDALTWRYDSAINILTISGEGAMYDYTYSIRPEYEIYKSEIETVIIEDGVTGIGEYAFYEFDYLEDAIIGNSVEHIGRYAFAYTNANYVDIPVSVRYIGPGAFPVSDWVMLDLKYHGTEEQWLKVDLDFDIYDLSYTIIRIVSENIRRGVCGDSLLWRFDGNTGIFEVTGSGAMYGYSLYVADIPWFDISNDITAVVIDDRVTKIGNNAFFSCENIKDVYYYGSADEWENVSIGYENDDLLNARRHYFCGKNEGVCGEDLKWSYDRETYTLSFEGVGEMYDYDSLNPAPWSECILYIKSIKVSDTVTSIGDYAFYDIRQAQSVELGASVKSIGKGAFGECTRLRKISLPSSLEKIDEDAFSGCSSVDAYITDLEAWCGIEFSSLSATPMFSGGKLYLNGEELTDLYIPDSVTVIKPYAFCCIDSLRTAVVGEGVTEIGHHGFASCSSLATVELGNGLKVLGNAVFEDCPSLTAIELPDGLESIGEGVFRLCFELNEINIPDSVKVIGCDVVFDTAYYDDSSNWENGFLYLGKHLIAAECGISGAYSVKEGTLTIADEVFFGYGDITELYIPDSVINIGKNCFKDCPDVVILTDTKNTYAAGYATENGIKYRILCDHIFTHYVSNNDATCVNDGTMTAYCDKACGVSDTVTEPGTATGIHNYGDWTVSIKPTYLTEGEETRSCNNCKAFETRDFGKFTLTVTVDLRTIHINCAEHIKDLRYARGVYTKPSEIKNAAGNVAISHDIVQKKTEDGVFTYEMSSSGHFTVWIRMTDGTEHILPFDIPEITPSVVSNGVTITILNLYNVKDLFIAKGEHQEYRDIKENGFIFWVGAAKLAGRSKFSYTVAEQGVHTVLIRYNDGRQDVFHETLSVDEPVFTANGMQVTVSDLSDVKVIRTAYGEWNSVKELKSSGSARSFTANADIRGEDSYTVQYREEGRVTVIVEYNNGYKAFFHCDVVKKVAGIMLNGNEVTITGIRDAKVIRYALGEYTTAAQIKRVPNARYINCNDFGSETDSITLPFKPGIYTVCVEFDEGSYSYHTITVE